MKATTLFISLLLAGAAAAQPGGGPQRWPDVNINKRDYQGNIPATDRNYFALSSQHPSVEFPAAPAIYAVAYVRGSTISLDVR